MLYMYVHPKNNADVFKILSANQSFTENNVAECILIQD